MNYAIRTACFSNAPASHYLRLSLPVDGYKILFIDGCRLNFRPFYVDGKYIWNGGHRETLHHHFCRYNCTDGVDDELITDRDTINTGSVSKRKSEESCF